LQIRPRREILNLLAFEKFKFELDCRQISDQPTGGFKTYQDSDRMRVWSKIEQAGTRSGLRSKIGKAQRNFRMGLSSNRGFWEAKLDSLEKYSRRTTNGEEIKLCKPKKKHDTSDREIFVFRNFLSAPRELGFGKSGRIPGTSKKWWGPEGFTSTISREWKSNRTALGSS